MILETNRLLINELTYNDSAFIITLLNQPSFKQFIGERHVNDLASASTFLVDGPFSTYSAEIGMYCVREKLTGKALGMCGFMQRTYLTMPDIGYAFLESEHGKGFALEAATAFMEKANNDNKHKKIAAMTNPYNEASVKLLKKLNFQECLVSKDIVELKNNRYFERIL